mmetsp:Transcript_21611/g.64067  ORF Transcript_21611/g.64067 Transcript_21611/m.64067 type:complete len:127 (-) Transcript_21611:986-1366(-)
MGEAAPLPAAEDTVRAHFEVARRHSSWADDSEDEVDAADAIEERARGPDRSWDTTSRDSSVASLSSTSKAIGRRRRRRNKKAPLRASAEAGNALAALAAAVPEAVPEALPLTRSAGSELAMIFEGL